MAKSVKALINPGMLEWARTQARIERVEAAQKLGIDDDRLRAMEEGDDAPTFAKLLDIADLYKRPVSLFYLDSPPQGWQPIQDFRLLPGERGGFSTQLTYAIRQAHERREVALSVKAELDEAVEPFGLAATLRTDVEALAQQVRQYLGVSDTAQLSFRKKAFDRWRAAIEAKDVLVFVIPRLKIREMRGAALAEDRLPVILINGKDRTNGRVFTLLHEFIHLALHQSGVSNAGGDRSGAPKPAVEQFCNGVAAAALMPRDWMLREAIVRNKGIEKTWSDEELRALAERFAVSEEAVLRRLLTLGRTTQGFYESKRPDYLRIYADLDERREPSEGGPQYHHVVLSQLGRGFTQTVLRGYHDQVFTLRDVAGILNMQASKVLVIEKAAFAND